MVLVGACMCGRDSEAGWMGAGVGQYKSHARPAVRIRHWRCLNLDGTPLSRALRHCTGQHELTVNTFQSTPI